MQIKASDELVQNKYFLRHTNFSQIDLHHLDDVLDLLFQLIRVERGAVLEQSKLRFGQVKRCSSSVVDLFDVSAILQKQRDHLDVVGEHGQMKRRVAIEIAFVCVRAVQQKKGSSFEVAFDSGQVKS